MNTLYICLIVLAVLVGGAGFYFIAKKLGLSLINVALSIVTAIRSALENSSLASSKFSVVLNLIIQALTYGNIVASGEDDEKVDFAMEYIVDISTKLGIKISESEKAIIRNVLEIGFMFMKSLGVQPIKYNKTFLRMARIAGVSKPERIEQLTTINARADLRMAKYE